MLTCATEIINSQPLTQICSWGTDENDWQAACSWVCIFLAATNSHTLES